MLSSKCLRAFWQVPSWLWPGCPFSQGKNVVVSAACLRSEGLPGQRGLEELRGPREVAYGPDGLFCTTQPALRLFTSLGPTPAASGRPGERSTIGRGACQSLGTFPGVGRTGPQHFLVSAPSQEPVKSCRSTAWPRPVRCPWTRGCTWRVGRCPRGLSPSGKPAGPQR